MTFTVRNGRRYRARVHLSWLEGGVVDDAAIADKLRAAGFENVLVTGSGRDRYALGTWAGPDTTADLDDHLSDVQEI